MNRSTLALIAILFASLGLSTTGHACLVEGKVIQVSLNRGVYTATLDNGKDYLFVGKKNPMIPMVKKSLETGATICITNIYDNYPSQLVARFSEFAAPTSIDQDCVKKGFIRSVYVNSKYDWFFLEDGFSIRVIHRSKVTPKLYEAAFSKSEVCINRMDLSGSGPTWGIPRDAIIIGRESSL